MRIGKVDVPGPVEKLAITRSSNDRVKASIQPAAIAGKISGNVTVRKVFSGGQPRSIAASSRLLSKPRSRDCTTTVTKLSVTVVCANVTVQNPRSTLSATKSSNSDSPVMTSGITSGAKIIAENKVRPGNRPARTNVTAASVPSTVAAVADSAAIRRLVQAASSM